MLDGEKSAPEGKNRIEAIDLLVKHMPEASFDLDVKDPQVAGVLAIYTLKPPLRAAYLVAIANKQYNMGTYTGIDIGWLRKASTTCEQLVREYPNTDHAKWAKEKLDVQIPHMKALAKDGPSEGTSGANEEQRPRPPSTDAR